MADSDTAIKLAKCALSVEPNNVFYRNALGLAYHAASKLDEALDEFDKSILLQSDVCESYGNKASVLIEQARFKEALETLDQGFHLNTQSPNLYVNKGVLLSRLGRVEEALQHFDEAIKLSPNSVDSGRNRLTLLNYSCTATAADIHLQTMDYWRLKNQNEVAVKACTHRPIKSDADKQALKIGYISADFWSHTIGKFFLPILTVLADLNVQAFLYSNSPIEDDVSVSLRSASQAWRPITGLTDETVCEEIKKDGVDILVDLSGHTDGHRLDVFRRKPAPVQMTWLGYVATTGLTEIDYIIADKMVLPENAETNFVEKPLRLPHSYYCFDPPQSAPALVPPPCLKSPNTTFGSFNNITKLNDDVFSAWSEILNRVPGSRLLIKAPQLSDDYIASSVKKDLERSGINTNTVVLLGQTTREDHMAMYNIVDIALDPFPYGGGMTTLEALWMGIPVITMLGDRWVSRASASILWAAGLADTITESRSDYIEKAIAMASDREGLIASRKNMRVIVASSPLCDIDGYAMALENLYRSAWRSWCLN